MRKPLLCLLIAVFFVAHGNALEIVQEWNLLNYYFPPNFNTSGFRPENTIATGIEITSDRIFIATPSLRSGVPAALSWIPRKTVPGKNVKLTPYPDWSYHTVLQGDFNCSGFISVYRTKIDSCNRLWVLDAGTRDSLENFKKVCNPKIMIFDLRTDKLVRSVVLPEDVLRPHSVVTNIVLDESIQGKCDSAYAYISDTVAPGLIVFDGAKDSVWRFVDPSFFPNPDYGTQRINNDQFSLMDGIIGLALAPQLGKLYYQAVATDRIYSVPTSALIKGPPGEFDRLPVSTAGRKSSQGMALTIDERDNTLFFSPFTENSIASWNILSNHQVTLSTDSIALQFVAETKLADGGYLYILSSRFQKYFLRSVDPSDVNVRILRIPMRPSRQPFYLQYL